MDNCEWMYNGFATKSNAWINGTMGFLKKAFGEAAKGSQRMSCPCTNCKNEKRKRQDDMWKDLHKHEFMANYTTWIYHGEGDPIREEVVRPRLEEYDGDAGIADLMEGFREARDNEVLEPKDPEKTAKAFYHMMSSAHKPLHEKTSVSQLDAIGRLFHVNSFMHLRCRMSRSMLVPMGVSYSGETTLREQCTVQSAKPLGLWR
jgi:hypothetical protein